eukprot:CAMPEP_0116021984 /NCGR_PEP_ID=MMETSP0321-20121206/10717_1 /TAXON_ID=163516 /ORGANISM="Leptocylindrus danicus var. danicus, Strain B650" /LENGTH=436 /DNA_ID=CAMNT_0003492969 /DNA_START=137 /DNA_END=1447 /DNA_ORIENTATION=+
MTKKQSKGTVAAVGVPMEVDLDSPEAGQFLAKMKSVEPEDWGTPGHFTEEQYAAFVALREELSKRGPEFRETVMCFGEEEGETYALCRWLRARKFNLSDTLVLMDEAKEERHEAFKADFYPDPSAALGAPVSTYIELYPQFYNGHAKNGAPLYISKPGVINTNSMECVTNLDGILNYHWHVMHHDFGNRLRERKSQMGDRFTKFACFCILDLSGLSASSINRSVMNIIKVQSKIDNTCYVETLSKMILVNAPVFFSASWKIIKGFLDKRTQNKIEIFSSKTKATARLLELVDAEYLPKDYGGDAEDSHKIYMRQNSSGSGLLRQDVQLMTLRSHDSYGPITLGANERMEVSIFTKSEIGASFKVTNDAKVAIASGEAVHKTQAKAGTEEFEKELPTNIQLDSSGLVGPGSFKIRADSKGSRMYSSNYLMSMRVLPK